MQTILHIGTEKTGTTSFQQWLSQHRSVMARNGWLVPTSLGKINHRRLSIIGYDQDRRDDATIMRELDSSEDLRVFQNLARYELELELNQARANGINKLIVSSELIHSRLTEKSEITRLLTTMVDLGCRPITVVLFLRDPARLANSKYSTSVRYEDMCMAEPPHPSESSYRQLCHHQASIELWEDVIGRMPGIRLMVQLYCEKNKGVVVAEILKMMNLQQGSLSVSPVSHTNQALSPLALELLRRLNITIPRFIMVGNVWRVNPERGSLVEWIEQLPLGARQYGMSKRRYQEYCEAFSESNNWVRKNYFPEKDYLFQCKLEEHRPSQVLLSPEELDGLAGAISNLWRNGC